MLTPIRIRSWISGACADVNDVAGQRVCVLLWIDAVAFALSIVVGLYALLVVRLGIADTDAWTSFGVTLAAGLSLILLLRGKRELAAHAAVFGGFAAIWVQVFARAGILTTQSAVTYVVAVLALPGLLLGRGWTLMYLAATVVLTAIGSAHLAMAHHFSRADAAAFGIDIVAGSAFVAFLTVFMGAMYERALQQVGTLACEQQARVAEVIELSESLQRSEAHKRQFYKDTIYSVTSGKLNIFEESDLQPYFESATKRAEIPDAASLAAARQQMTFFCLENGLKGEGLESLAIGFGEAMANAVKHADGGTVYAGRIADSVWVAVVDNGPGIESLILPRAVLLAGFSTKPSLGLGYTIMLEVADRVFLKTSETGTAVVLVKDITEEASRPPEFYDRMTQGEQ